MSSNSISRPGQGTRPLVVLAAWLENAHHRDDKVVSFPANTSEAIRQARPLGAQYGLQDVQAIVLALDYPESTVCERLDSLSLTILCSIFMYSQECLAQQRGLCLLAGVLHRKERDMALELAQKQGKKVAIGKAALTQLVKGFLKMDASDKLRRWLGILALELLKDCPENAEKLRSDPPEERYWQNLSEVIEHGSCQVLKLLAGSMIREMLSSGVSPDNFWQSETSSELYSRFPRGKHHDSQWVTSFEEFVDELLLAKILTREVSNVMFAHAVYLGDRNWNLKEASDILVTLSEELNIVIPANDANAAVYIDVPLDFILEVSFDNALILDSQQPIYGVVIRLDSKVTTNCILNAIGYVEHHMALAFSSDKDANTLKRLLIPTNFRADGLALRDRSGVSDASEQQILSEDELAAPDPALSNSQGLIGTGNGAGTINPSMLERGHSSQRGSTEHNEGCLIVGHRVAMAAEGIDVSQNDILVEQAIEGIDVSQSEDLNHEETQHRNSQAYISDKASSNAPVQIAQALGNGNQKAIGRFDRESDIRPSSFLRGHEGHNAIENVPQLRAQRSEQAVSYVKQVENGKGPEGQDEEHDDLYYASPKAKNGRRRSPRTLARGNTPKALNLSLEPIVRQANTKSGPPVKLSRQLRNAEGVVESHTEPIADDDLAALMENDAVDVKTSANKKKIRVLAPAKIGNGLKGSAKPVKKTAQSKGKAVAIEEPVDTSLDNYDLPPSPKRAETIQTPGNKTQATSTRLKATRAPRNKQKKAKPRPKKAPTAASSKNTAPQLRNEFKNNAEANDPVQNSPLDRPSSKKIDDEVDVDQAHGEKEHQITRQSRQPAKTARKQDVRIPKFQKNMAQTQLQSDQARTNKPPTAHDQDTVASLVKAKAAPAALSQPRPRRTAAIKANKKIQGLEESDDIVDDEGTEPALTRIKRHIPLIAAKSRKDQKVRSGEDGQQISSGKLPAAKLSMKDFIPDSVSPDSSHKERPNSVSDPKAGSSPEKVILLRNAAAEALRAVADDKRDNLRKGNPTKAAETSMIPLHPGLGDRSNQPDPISAEQGAEVDLEPGSGPQLRESITKTEPAPISSQQDEGVKQRHDDVKNTRSVGPGDQNEVENVVRCIDDGSLTLNSDLDDVEENATHPQAPTAPMDVRIREIRTSPRLTGAAEKILPEPTPTRRDPFVAKLNASMPPSKGTNAKVKSSDVTRDVNLESKGPKTSNSGELERSLRESKARAMNTPGAVRSGEAEPIGNGDSRRRLKSPMQMDGESSAMQSLKPAGESISASGVEAKRKTGQIGDTSNKRVKLVSKERLEGFSAKKTPAFDVNKTPPPVVSNRPLLIGFSASGPRNQGTISTKKSKPPEDVRNVAPDVAELRKHEVSNRAVNQVHADFAFIQEALETSVEDIQPEVKVAAGAQKEVPASAHRKQARHLKGVHAAVTGEAQKQENGAEKRKLAPFLDDPALGEHEQLSKRQKRNMETPPNAQKHHPQMFPDISPALIHDRSQRFSSQNTRVNENGSPMPFFITRNGNTIAEEQYADDEDDGKDALTEARLVERLMLQEDDLILPEPVLPLQPLVSAVSTTQPKARAYQSLSNNSKQVPSSPHASSAFGTMPPHHLYHDGEIVNAETKQSILPAKPQDPFLGATQKPPNSFMDALRKSTEFAAKSLVSGAETKRDLGSVVMRQGVNVGEDPDKTLVEPNLRKRYRKVHVSDSSSSSQSGTSTQVSQPYESSEEDSEAETEARWRKELEPHQENMLDCLLTISHRLIRHLIDKETAINDMVTDFAKHGNSLIDSYEKALQEQIDSHKAVNEQRRQNLVKTLEKAQADVATTSKAVVKRHVHNMQVQWQTQQEALMGKVAAALEACAE